ncbi:hypothetical protein GVN24_31415 [Rhizobium sp. CRIBSB]|nr:hypothetical protein [Rhizobium sp. CRIBSB]
MISAREGPRVVAKRVIAKGVVAKRVVAQGVAALLLFGCAAAPPPLIRPDGYLAPGAMPEIMDRSVQTVPATLTASDDRRWMAMAHAELRPAFVAGHFDCALGFRLSGRDMPALRRLFARLDSDIEARISRATAAPGPLAAPPCIRTRFLPAGTGQGRAAAVGAAFAGALALIVPERGSELRAIGAAIGDSARLCGLANGDQTVRGAALGLGVLQAASATPDFIRDLAEARTEVEAARASALTSPACAAERRALAAN